MNWLEISIGIIFLICIITGLIRGAVRIIVSLVATIVTLVIVFFATPYVSQTIEKYTPLDDMIRQKVVSTMAMQRHRRSVVETLIQTRAALRKKQ